MYRDFFQLEKFPFNNNPDPSFLCMLPHAREALACLEYGVAARKGFLVLLGEVGTGKTTLLRSALNTLRGTAVHTSFIFNPRLETLEFLQFMLSDFGLTPVNDTKAGMLLQLNRWLVERFAAGDTCVLIVDEAQSLSSELLEEIRLLTNLETDTQKLLQIVLSGQPELETKLREPGLRQLRQRISLWCRTQALSQEQTGEYIEQRLSIAGAKETIFLPDTIKTIYEFSRGIPRLVNLLCEHSLILAYVEKLKQVPASLVFAVAVDLDLDNGLGAAAGITAGSRRSEVPVVASSPEGKGRE
ncbi:type II secretory pathway, component ExeA (predicted ATPase) [Terriglobus roseus DSM 18391]|uniref:Type II secretory pathway, component ExeA (Predicted ATPase) n=1 Tax=Terriglobus roseus (strain DSM 18391 / NRRL B-41598 / KBS 63) TaxID=926566 RepID=I3ZIJ2_TERRK|nr:AAA family ATPase [Terriglobus roseus]AFL89060.1 type II secretory pathway, component ExeA (predicted ATPase) [Terriglobus roseus DSM 18391]